MTFPNGHFYSPVVDLAEARRDEARIWPSVPKDPAGVDWNREGHKRFLQLVAALKPSYEASYGRDVAFGRTNPRVLFQDENGTFEKHDARALFTALRSFEITRVTEVGSGWSSRLVCDTLGKGTITCIEPYPDRGLLEGLHVLPVRAQDVAVESYVEASGPHTLLFIDGSHVAKTGSDVVYLYLEVIPRLHPGTLVHIHDIFLPYDYPRAWLERGQSWNEQYMLQALLQNNRDVDVVYGNSLARAFYPGELAEAMGHVIHEGGSFYFLIR